MQKLAIILALISMAACAPRNCENHYSNACHSADIAKSRIFGNYNELHNANARYNPVTEIIAKDQIRRDLEANAKPLSPITATAGQ